MFAWCTVYVLSWSHSIVWCTIYLFGVPFTFWHSHTRLCGVPYVCLVYRLVLSWSHLTVWCTICLFGVPFTFWHSHTRLCGVPYVWLVYLYVLSWWSYSHYGSSSCWYGVTFVLYHVCTVYRLCFISVILPLLGDFHVWMVCFVHVVTVLMSARPYVALLQLPPMHFSVFSMYLQKHSVFIISHAFHYVWSLPILIFCISLWCTACVLVSPDMGYTCIAYPSFTLF